MANRYFIIRHGHSKANEIGKIVSSPNIGIAEYGLTEKGKKQVQSAAEAFSGSRSTIICSSDFLRAKETAEILKSEWNCRDILYRDNLHERFFGDFEGLGDEFYNTIWEIDKRDGDYLKLSIESPAEVAVRVTDLITELDSMYTRKDIILVSHGDCLQILQTVRQNIAPSHHRSLPHLDNAIIKEI